MMKEFTCSSASVSRKGARQWEGVACTPTHTSRFTAWTDLGRAYLFRVGEERKLEKRAIRDKKQGK